MYACIRFNAWRPCICAAATALAILLLDGSALADTLHVPADFRTIQSAIDAAADDDEIVVAPGTYHEAINFLGKAITVRSSGGREVTTIDASTLPQPVSVVTFVSGEGRDSVLEGFTITGGEGTSVKILLEGGGAFVSGSSPTIAHCHFQGNVSGAGGGLVARNNASPLIDSCHFTGNEGAAPELYSIGGAVLLLNATAQFMNCQFTANSADLGGAVTVAGNLDFEPAVFQQCTFTENRGAQGHAANINLNAHAEFKDCLFQDGAVIANPNVQPQGGAVFLLGQPFVQGHSEASFVNCHFQGNQQVLVPGAAIRSSGHVSVEGCTFTDNDGTAIGTIGAGAALSVIGSSFVDNSLGGISIDVSPQSPTATISDCEFVGHAVESALTASGDINVTNSTFKNNSAIGQGGAIGHFGGGVLSVEGCTFIENSAAQGGAIWTVHATVQDSFFCENAPDDVDGFFWTDLGGNEFLDECPSPIPGDLDGDGSVGVQDLLLLLGAWGSCDDCTPGKSMCFGDLDGDCTVGVADLLILLANWG